MMQRNGNAELGINGKKLNDNEREREENFGIIIGWSKRKYSCFELNAGESTSSSKERRGIEANPFGGRGCLDHVRWKKWWGSREKFKGGKM